MRQSRRAMVIKIAVGFLFVLSSFSLLVDGNIGSFFLGVPLGVVIIAWGIVPWYRAKKQRKAEIIEEQVSDIEVYCRRNNLRVVKTYADRALSGTTDKRPQFQQMMKDAAHGKTRYVVVWKMDRFARNRYDSATYKYRLKQYGVRVLSASVSPVLGSMASCITITSAESGGRNMDAKSGT